MLDFLNTITPGGWIIICVVLFILSILFIVAFSVSISEAETISNNVNGDTSLTVYLRTILGISTGIAVVTLITSTVLGYKNVKLFANNNSELLSEAKNDLRYAANIINKHLPRNKAKKILSELKTNITDITSKERDVELNPDNDISDVVNRSYEAEWDVEDGGPVERLDEALANREKALSQERAPANAPEQAPINAQEEQTPEQAPANAQGIVYSNW